MENKTHVIKNDKLKKLKTQILKLLENKNRDPELMKLHV